MEVDDVPDGRHLTAGEVWIATGASGELGHGTPLGSPRRSHKSTQGRGHGHRLAVAVDDVTRGNPSRHEGPRWAAGFCWEHTNQGFTGH